MATILQEQESFLRESIFISTVLAVVVFAGPLVVARAGAGSWLDDEVPLNWNSLGATVPAAPAIEGRLDPRATARERSPEIPEDNALIASGWRLFTSYQAGWGLKVIEATTMYDGMGRPWGYQTFVFADGKLAGTLAPEPMFSRFDGALDRTSSEANDRKRSDGWDWLVLRAHLDSILVGVVDSK